MDKKMEKLLKLLQDDAKLTVQELAVMLDMTEAEVAAAIHKFEKDGVIKGYHAAHQLGAHRGAPRHCPYRAAGHPQEGHRL